MSDVYRKDFPAIKDEDWEEMEEYKSPRDDRERKNNREIWKIEKRMAALVLDDNVGLGNRCDTGDIRVVLIGKTGTGKSATANTIFGEDKFQTSRTSRSQTQISKRVAGKVNGRNMTVVDTPGFADTGRSDKDIKKEIARFAEFLPDGVHAFIYVINMASPRYTEEDKRVFRHIKDMLGDEFEKYCLLVFTHPGPDLKEYCREEIEEGTPLGEFLGKLDWRVTAIDNKAPTVYEQQKYRDNLLSIISKMAAKHQPSVYTNEAFKKAQDMFQVYQAKAQKENWDESVLDLVEEIIGLDPEISRADLEKEVQAKIRERLLKELMQVEDHNREQQKELEDKSERLHTQATEIVNERAGLFDRILDYVYKIYEKFSYKESE